MSRLLKTISACKRTRSPSRQMVLLGSIRLRELAASFNGCLMLSRKLTLKVRRRQIPRRQQQTKVMLSWRCFKKAYRRSSHRSNQLISTPIPHTRTLLRISICTRTLRSHMHLTTNLQPITCHPTAIISLITSLCRRLRSRTRQLPCNMPNLRGNLKDQHSFWPSFNKAVARSLGRWWNSEVSRHFSILNRCRRKCSNPSLRGVSSRLRWSPGASGQPIRSTRRSPSSAERPIRSAYRPSCSAKWSIWSIPCWTKSILWSAERCVRAPASAGSEAGAPAIKPCHVAAECVQEWITREC
jgi:hypothetical protein